MPFSPASLWPGLAALWRHGRLAGLAAALVWGGLLNAAVWLTFAEIARPAWAGSWQVRTAAWFLVLGLWIVGFRANRKGLEPPQPLRSNPELDAWLVQAQTEYLKGHWLEAETLVAKILARNPADAEARLLQASILRRTKRIDQSKQLLEALSATDLAGRWNWEIQAEITQLNDLQAVDSSNSEHQTIESTDSLRRAA